jgi:MoxR-like ATPase
MRRQELLEQDIHTLRRLAVKAGLETRKRDQIIAALADDYRTPVEVIEDLISFEPPPVAPLPSRDTAPEQGEEATIWPQVPLATCHVNGGYVTPDWAGQLKAAVSFGHVDLKGPAGSGKTLAVHKLAASQERRLAIITADGGLRKRDLVGQRELIGGRTVFQASEFASAARDGDWALIDEANMAEADALGFLNGMLDRPGTEGSTFNVGGKAIAVHPNFRCFITRNPGYAGTKAMNEALMDRFWSIEVPPLLGDSLDQMLKAHGVTDNERPVAVAVVEALFAKWKQHSIRYQISPRRVLAASSMAKHMVISTVKNKSVVAKQIIFEGLLKDSILTKIEGADHDAVKQIINEAIRAIELTKKATKKENSNV